MKAAARANEAGAEIEVFAWCETAVRWFFAGATQWRRGPDGRAAGLDYAGIEAAARLAGLAPEPQDFAWLGHLERAVLAELRGRG